MTNLHLLVIDQLYLLNLDGQMNSYTCWICDGQFQGWPNNAEPISIGVCCDQCNYEFVIPARFGEY